MFWFVFWLLKFIACRCMYGHSFTVWVSLSVPLVLVFLWSVSTSVFPCLSVSVVSCLSVPLCVGLFLSLYARSVMCVLCAKLGLAFSMGVFLTKWVHSSNTLLCVKFGFYLLLTLLSVPMCLIYIQQCILLPIHSYTEDQVA